MYDKSSHDDHQPALVGFIGGANARAWSSKSAHARKQAVLTQMRRFYPSVPEATQPSDYFEHDWAQEEYSRGCYVNIMTPGVMTECGEHLRKPIGRLHWAGSETGKLRSMTFLYFFFFSFSLFFFFIVIGFRSLNYVWNRMH